MNDASFVFRRVPSMALWVGALLFVAASLFRGGNRYVPLILLEWLAMLALLLTLVASSNVSSLRQNSPTFQILGSTFLKVIVILSPVWVPALQLLPFDRHVAIGSSGALSLSPSDTWLSLLAGLPLVASALLALHASREELAIFVRVWIGVATFQAALGLLQLGFPELRFSHFSSTTVIGTFGNRNGLANFIVMVLPLVVILLQSLTKSRGEPARFRSAPMSLWLGAGALLLLLAGLLVTLSRTGIATGVLVLFLSALLLNQSSSGRKRNWRAGLLWPLSIMALLALALFAGGWEWLGRFESDQLAAGDAIREMNRNSAWLAVQAYWPLGSGMGTFGTVFPQFASPEMGVYFVNFAHNDYLETLIEAGALAIPPAVVLTILVLKRTIQLAGAWRQGWSESDRLSAASGIALLAQCLHAWVDFPWQIPANAMLGCFMLGVFLRQPGRHTLHRSREA